MDQAFLAQAFGSRSRVGLRQTLIPALAASWCAMAGLLGKGFIRWRVVRMLKQKPLLMQPNP